MQKESRVVFPYCESYVVDVFHQHTTLAVFEHASHVQIGVTEALCNP